MLKYHRMRGMRAVLLCMLLVGAAAKRKKYADGWWPEERRSTDITLQNPQSIWWPQSSGMQPSGRVSVVKQPWEPAQNPPTFPKLTLSSVETVDYWAGTAAKVAYGNTMNTFQCLKLDGAEAVAVVAAVIKELPQDLGEVQWTTTGLSRLILRHTADYGVSQLEIELGGQRTREHRRGHFVVWSATLGASYYFEASGVVSPSAAATLFPSADGSPRTPADDGVGVEVVLRAGGTYGSDNRLVLTEVRVVQVPSTTAAPEAAVVPSEHPGLNVMSFNVWNTNPPHWLLGGEARVDRYLERMDLLADVVKATSPAIIGFQEVRYDQTIGGPGGRLQMKHLADRLPAYRHYAYIPAMSYYDTRAMRREEEGPAIASIYPIVHTEYVLLSRDLGDAERDPHQRACIHAVIDVPQWGLVDVFTVHLSLAEEARDRSVRELWRAVSDPVQSRGVTQILLGDMNAEPQERAMRFLAGLEEIDGEVAKFTDAWTSVHPEPVPRSNETWDIDEALTFPSDAPSKRIDFIFVKGKGADSVRKTWLVGQAPKPDVGRDTEEEEDHLGMVHADSKLWASDHRGIVTQLGGPAMD